ncbi:XRE family transcriptional regulator [Thioalkalivibrio nitratireducens DSM 14787]|uniref:XRE family transcriptional regulator n=1 Tax=Thioalkalivibrio nitratireducens (strain DSM 14787 / UNIQEM 213 / ALEN2) TaxID=1255043 RepID=L0DU91_THIND|nr:XRE family transcriptional regulator [Thioalkalivibrio nitratireducens DSM 14787]
MFGHLDDVDDTGDLSAGTRLHSGNPRSEDEYAAAVVTGLSADRSKRDRVPTPDASDAGIPAVGGLNTRVPQPTPPTGDQDPLAGSPGAGMRGARERRGLDVGTLAMRTRLSRRIIEAMEANRFDSIPPAYVRGYLRAVARELGADAEGWIRAYEGMGYADPVVRPTVQRNPSGHWGLSGAVWYTMVAAILVTAFGLGIYAWTEGEPERTNPLARLVTWVGEIPSRFASAPPEPVAPDHEPLAGVSPAPAVPSDEGIGVTRGEDGRPPGPVTEPLVLEPLSGPIAPSAELETAPPLQDPAPAGARSPAAPQTVAPPRQPEPAGTDPAPATPPGVETDAPSPEVPVPDTAVTEALEPAVARPDTESAVLSLMFEDTSWVEVRSASDRVELRGIYHAGDEQRVVVELPARVVLGNAPGVRLVRDAAPLDLAPHTRGDRTARFSVEVE